MITFVKEIFGFSLLIAIALAFSIGRVVSHLIVKKLSMTGKKVKSIMQQQQNHGAESFGRFF